MTDYACTRHAVPYLFTVKSRPAVNRCRASASSTTEFTPPECCSAAHAALRMWRAETTSSKARACQTRVVRVGERGGGTTGPHHAADLFHVARATYDGEFALSLWSPLLHAVPIHPGRSPAGYDPAALVPTICITS